MHTIYISGVFGFSEHIGKGAGRVYDAHGPPGLLDHKAAHFHEPSAKHSCLGQSATAR